MTIGEAKKLLPPNLKYPLPDGVIDNLINCTSIPCRFDIKDEDGTSENLGYAYALLAALIELKERREREDKELAERALEIERDDWEREE
jgi:hypothetical protein